MTRFGFAVSAMSLCMLACGEPTTPPEETPPALDAQLRQSLARSGVVPVGEMPAQAPALVELGRVLFFDRELSGNRDISCGTCHHPTTSLSDGLSLSIGTGGAGIGSTRTLGAGRQLVPRSAPTLLNSGLGMTYLFWDGRLSQFGPTGVRIEGGPLPSGNVANALAAQALLPVIARHEMLGNAGDVDVSGKPNELAAIGPDRPAEVWSAIMKRLLAIPEYVTLFQAAFPGKATSTLRFEDAALALATFQREAFTHTRSPFDRYLDRDDAALTLEQKRGALLFFNEARCGTCHTGPFLGAQGFANVGAPQIGPGGTLKPPLDLGRGELQNNSFYRFAFRVAPLRNVELTAPYMHSGAYASLAAVVRHYDNVPRALRNYNIHEHAPNLATSYHGSDATINDVLSTLDHRLRTPMNLTETQMQQLVAFLKSLTDPAARALHGVAPTRVPSGLPVE